MSCLEVRVKEKQIPSGVVVTLAVMCAWCRLWRVDTVWTPRAPANVSKVSHGICPACAEKMLAGVSTSPRPSPQSGEGEERRAA